MEREQLRLRRGRAQPGDAGALEAADFVEREHEAARADHAGQPAQRVDANRRLLADERQREMNQVGQSGPAAALERDLAREAGEQRASRGVGPESEENALGGRSSHVPASYFSVRPTKRAGSNSGISGSRPSISSPMSEPI